MSTTASLALLASALLPAAPHASPDTGEAEMGQALPIPLDAQALNDIANALFIDEPGDGRTWARGPKWKASLGPEGLVYLPFFGSDAPQNYPVAFDLSQVTVGGKAIELNERERSRNGETVTLDRGSAREVYHLAQSSIEQTFVFDRLPGNGELILDVDVETELKVSPNGAGFTFHNELGEVRYGAATVIDAAGRSLALQQTLTSSGFQIVVPSDFVTKATYPITVDPILSTFTVEDNSRRQLDLDVAYEANNSVYQIVFSQLQSAIDSDVLTVNYNVSLDLLVSSSSIDISSASWRLPSNASNFHEQQFLCAAIVGPATGTQRVWGRTRHAGTGARGSQFQISGVGAVNVDVGGKGNDISSIYDYMVVWQEVDSINQDFDIVAQAVRGDDQLTGSRIIIDGDASDLDRFPSISKSSGRPTTANVDNEYMIVWEREVGTDDRNIRAQVIEYTGTMTGHNQFNAYTFSDSRRPDVSTWSETYSYSGERYWMIAFERALSVNYRIFLVVAFDGSADNARNVHTMQNLEILADHRDPCIASDGHDYLIAYQTTQVNGDRVIHYTGANVVHDDGELRTGLAERRRSFGTSENGPSYLAIASDWDGGSTASAVNSGNALAIWTEREDTTGDSDAYGALITERSANVLGSQFCEANANSTGEAAWITAHGNTWAAGSSARLSCHSLPLQSFGHFIVSNQSGFVMNPGGSQGNLCLQGSIGRFRRPGEVMNSGTTGYFEISFDSDDLPSPMGTTGVAPGETWYYQCWFRDVGPSSNFSNAIEVTYD